MSKYVTVAQLITRLQQCDPNALVCENSIKYDKNAVEADLEGGGSDEADLYTGPLVVFRSWD